MNTVNLLEVKEGKFPIGHPDIFVGDEFRQLTGENNCLSMVEGLVKCRILPPRDLFLPVLPVRVHKRLMFPLCQTYCENLEQEDCNHERLEDRELTGTWVSEELKKAVRLGYKITVIYEIWQYKVKQYNPEKNEPGLFVDYINTFFKLKQQASGYASDCKFGQRENMGVTEVINDQVKLIEILQLSDRALKNVLPVNQETFYINWAYTDDNYKPSSVTNVSIAAYTTALDRLKLYSYLEKLCKRVLYYDTDSCIYINKNTPGEYKVPTRCFLGDRTDELESCGIKVI
ncbi:uncharacterized protein LOC107981175 [Nasonia vitripennis]|uniref:DNA-directed DNA polymerase n=1 Tax=Nasonia vitripennis TaxID=7425 RepID=A0A7M7M7B3_NASVI|nr:uncharacterized protein LOC107981175 [Nasonia vitripennis]